MFKQEISGNEIKNSKDVVLEENINNFNVNDVVNNIARNCQDISFFIDKRRGVIIRGENCMLSIQNDM
ncbi:MAG: hypothetical protein OH338_01430 [Candidatus Parvarchaeota archaeon]|nr:hypothetical protein [Candidatus Parvarchaeum tengchongense]MCW1298974.1 hypothetical protein [Candidatus Parvarchaeum tengchongense]MCW1312076.1 hypothetical protein [Candidatus Parvarchaeum tengchongense]